MAQVRLQDSVKSELEDLREHPKEPVGDVILRLVKSYSDEPKYDDNFKDFVKYVIREHFDVEEIHVTECASGLQVLGVDAYHIMIPHLELKMWKWMMNEGCEPSKDSYSLIDVKIAQSNDMKLR